MFYVAEYKQNQTKNKTNLLLCLDIINMNLKSKITDLSTRTQKVTITINYVNSAINQDSHESFGGSDCDGK